jgi:predicted phage terminase large subunit-like protein
MRVSKASIKKWKEHCKTVQDATGVEAWENFEEKEKRKIDLLGSYEKFCNFYFPHFCKAPFAKYHLDAANKVIESKNLRAVFEWYRSGAKSVNFSLMLPIYLMFKGELNVMVLVSKSEDAACMLLGDIQSELQYNQRIVNDYGTLMNLGSWETGRFSTTDGKSFFALGRGQSPRGIRGKSNGSRGGMRPDYIVSDDIDDDELSQNESRVTKLTEWILTALFGCMAVGEGRFIITGNRISKNSVIAKMAEVPGIVHTVVNVTDENGEPSWKERYTIEQINEVVSTIGTRNAQKEYYNNPLSDGTVFKLSQIRYKKINLADYKYLLAYTDPSWKSHSKADYKATVVVGMNNSGEFHIIKAYVEQETVSAMVNWHYEIFNEYLGKIPVHFYMEGNLLQDLLFREFYTEGEKRGLQIPILSDKTNKGDKFTRIEALQPLFEKGFVFFNEDEKENRGAKRLIEQLLMCEKGNRYPIDGPDALQGAIETLRKRTVIEMPITLGKRGEGKYRNVMRY